MRYYVPPYSRVSKTGHREDVKGYWRRGKPGDGGPGLPAGSPKIPESAYQSAPRAKAKVGTFHNPVFGTDTPPPDFSASSYIRRSDLSNPDTPRSREVSPEEFRSIYDQGEKRWARLYQHGNVPKGLIDHWARIRDDAWESIHEPWGGVTINAQSAEKATSGYAFSIKKPGQKTVRIPIGANRATFDVAMAEARQTFGRQLAIQNAYLGVFRDEDTGTIDIDPTMVVDSLDEAETLGTYTHAVGGAYHFEDGDGYWPPHIKEGADLAQEDDALPGDRRLALAGDQGAGLLLALAAPRPGPRPAGVPGQTAARTGPGRTADVEDPEQAVARYLSLLR